MGLFALGWKGWVELRRARAMPVAECSQIQHVIDPASLPYWARARSLTLKQLHFKGGTFLASLPRRRFASLTRLRCPMGQVIPIPPPLAVKLLQKVHHESA